MKKILAIGIITCIALLFLTASCDVNPSKMSDEYAKEMASKLTYTKDDRTGLCFAVITSRKTADTDQTGLGMTEVPCSEVQHLIK